MRSSIAIIPARGGSKRLARKNILPVGGKPMLGWPVQVCLESGIFDSVIVSTEDAEIAKIARKQGARVIERPAVMATDTAHEFEAYRHVLETLKSEGRNPDFFCGVYATAILLSADDLAGAFDKIKSQDADVVMGVSAYPIHPYKALEQTPNGFSRMVYPEWCLQRSQNYPRYVASNGTFYFIRTAAFPEMSNYYPERLATYEIPLERAVDIDDAGDFARAELLMNMRLGSS